MRLLFSKRDVARLLLNTDYSVEERCVLAVLCLVAEEDGLLVSQAARRCGWVVPCTLSGLAREIGGSAQRSKVLRILKRLQERGVIKKVTLPSGKYRLYLNFKSVSRWAGAWVSGANVVFLRQERPKSPEEGGNGFAGRCRS